MSALKENPDLFQPRSRTIYLTCQDVIHYFLFIISCERRKSAQHRAPAGTACPIPPTSPHHPHQGATRGRCAGVLAQSHTREHHPRGCFANASSWASSLEANHS